MIGKRLFAGVKQSFVNHPFLSTSLIWLAAADIATTFVALELGAAEANPLARKFIHDFGIFSLFPLKGLSLGFLLLSKEFLVVLRNVDQKVRGKDFPEVGESSGLTGWMERNIRRNVLGIACVFTFAAVVNNLMIVLAMA